VGERDLVVGLENLRDLAGRAEFHFLAANLLNKEGAPVLETSVIKELGGIKVGIIGLLGQRAAAPRAVLEADGLHIAPPAEIAKAEAQRLKKDGAELLVVLSHLGHGEERIVAAAVPEIQFFFGSHTGRRLNSPVAVQRSPEIATTAYWVEAGSRGKYLGRLEIYPNSAGDLTTMVDAGQSKTLEESIQRREASLATTKKRLEQLESQKPVAGQESRHTARVNSTKRSVQHMEKQIANERTKLATLPAPSADHTLFLNHLDPVDLAIVERTDIKEKVAALQSTGLLTPAPRKIPARAPLAGKVIKPQPKPIAPKPAKP